MEKLPPELLGKLWIVKVVEKVWPRIRFILPQERANISLAE